MWQTRKIETLFKLKDKSIHQFHVIKEARVPVMKFTFVILRAILKYVLTNIPM